MLCPSVPVQTRSSVGLKRESGVNPELPRSGKAETNVATCTGRPRLGSGDK